MRIESYDNMFWIQMENIPELTYKFMSMLEDVTIQKYYWRSKYDETYLELQEPKVYDAFYFHIDIIGKPEKINKIIDDFILIQDTYRHLNNCLKLTEEEIKGIADKALTDMFIFQ